jgi:hypothetical protein
LDATTRAVNLTFNPLLRGCSFQSCLNGSLERDEMVKFQVRWLKKRYKKNKEYRYKYYFLGFPVKANEKIEPQIRKDFDLDEFTCEKKSGRELIHITWEFKTSIELLN